MTLGLASSSSSQFGVYADDDQQRSSPPCPNGVCPVRCLDRLRSAAESPSASQRLRARLAWGPQIIDPALVPETRFSGGVCSASFLRLYPCGAPDQAAEQGPCSSAATSSEAIHGKLRHGCPGDVSDCASRHVASRAVPSASRLSLSACAQVAPLRLAAPRR